ncbi:MAG: hypothetical protein GQ574_16985 [Crocinitomix sp.]|nr:hypothetical protein [Crocinitomix sp.]
MKSLTVLFLFFVIQANGQFIHWRIPTEMSGYELVGTVKTVSQKVYYNYRGKKNIKQLIKNSDNVDNDYNSRYYNLQIEFSPTGKITKGYRYEWHSLGIGYNHKALVKFEFECSYNENDDCSYFIMQDGSVDYDEVNITRDSLVYNENGALLERYSSMNGVLNWTYYYTYDGDHRLKSNQTFCFGKPSRERSYEYDSLGYTIINEEVLMFSSPITESRFNMNDNIVYVEDSSLLDHKSTRVDYTYNGVGLLTKSLMKIKFDTFAVNGPSEHSLVDLYEYDAQGNCTLFEQYDPEGVVWKKVLRKFSKDGLLVEEVNIQDSGQGNTMIDRKKIFNYDSLNNLILLEHQYVSFGKVETRFTKYEYDAQGNWVNRAMHGNGRIMSYVEREITYY